MNASQRKRRLFKRILNRRMEQCVVNKYVYLHMNETRLKMQANLRRVYGAPTAGAAIDDAFFSRQYYLLVQARQNAKRAIVATWQNRHFRNIIKRYR